MPSDLPAYAVAAVDQQYTDTKNLLNIMLQGVKQQLDEGVDEPVAWAGTVQAVIKEAEGDDDEYDFDYIGKMMQLSVAAVIKLAKQQP